MSLNASRRSAVLSLIVAAAACAPAHAAAPADAARPSAARPAVAARQTPPPSRPLDPRLAAKNPADVMPSDPAATMIFRGKESGGTAAWRPGVNGASVLRVENGTPSRDANRTQIRWSFGVPVKKGDVLLARFLARAEYAKQESGEAAFEFSVQQPTPEFARHVLLPLSVGTEWTLFEVPFVAPRDAAPTQGEIALAFGGIAQAVEIADLRVLNFADRAKVAELPQTRFTYKGRAADAAWRAAALARIEKIRTAPLEVRVLDAAGRPVAGAKVEARLVRPAFLWATATDAELIVGDTPDAERTREALRTLFDGAVLGNDFKWPRWSGSPENRDRALRATDWLAAQGKRMRGHTLVWPADKFSPRRIAAMPAPRAELGPLIQEHIRDILTATRGRIEYWDVLNELLHEKEYLKYLPESEVAEWFKLARAVDPRAKLAINDYGMLNGRNSPAKIDEYVTLIKRLCAAGAPIDVAGVQGHVGRQVREPADVLSDLDRLAATGLEIQISEFDINSPDEELQADYTRDFLIALYSHPSVTGFTMWGFWEGRHWKPDAAMFRKDWTEKPNLKAWRDLVWGAWRTRVDGRTDAAGKVAARGHLGDYEFTVTGPDGKILKQTRALTADGVRATVQFP